MKKARQCQWQPCYAIANQHLSLSVKRTGTQMRHHDAPYVATEFGENARLWTK